MMTNDEFSQAELHVMALDSSLEPQTTEELFSETIDRVHHRAVARIQVAVQKNKEHMLEDMWEPCVCAPGVLQRKPTAVSDELTMARVLLMRDTSIRRLEALRKARRASLQMFLTCRTLSGVQ